MVTARTQGADIVEAFRLGANDYVTKPIDFPVALARIGTHLSHKRAVEDLRESEERYALAVRGANDGLWDWNLGTNEVYWSPRWKAMLGLRRVGDRRRAPTNGSTRVHTDDRRPGEGRAGGASRRRRAAHYESEHRILHRNGTFRWVLCRGAAVRNGAGRGDAPGRIADRHHRRQGRRCVDRAAESPAVRRSARPRDQADRAAPGLRLRAARPRPRPVQGRERQPGAADRGSPARRGRPSAAVEPARHRCRDARRAGFTLARLGGDEFTVLLDDITDASDAIRVAERLRRALEQPFDVEGHQVFTSATVGIAVSTTGYGGRRRSCAMRRSRSIARRPTARRPASSSIRRCGSARCRACSSKPICGTRSSTRQFDRALPADRLARRPAASPDSRRWCGGAIRRAGWSARSNSSRSRKTPG